MYLNECEIVETGNGTAVVRGPCLVTGKTHQTPPVPVDALVAYVDGRLAQDAFPMLPAEEREFLVSGTSPEGWRIVVLGLEEGPEDPAEATAEGEVIAKKARCRECGEELDAELTPTEHDTVCSACRFWHEQHRRPGGIVIDGRHYRIMPDDHPIQGVLFRGFGGRQFVVARHDGIRLVTTDLWTQGDIPARFRHLFPDNARFVGESEQRDSGGVELNQVPLDVTAAARGQGFPHRLLVAQDLVQEYVIGQGGTQEQMAWRLSDIIFAADMAVKCARGEKKVPWHLCRGDFIAADITVYMTRLDGGETTVTMLLDKYYPPGQEE